MANQQIENDNCDECEQIQLDGDGFVICRNCGLGGGKCDGECDEEESDE